MFLLVNKHVNKTSASKGAWKCNFLPFQEIYRQTNHPTNQPTHQPTTSTSGHRDVTLLVISNHEICLLILKVILNTKLLIKMILL